MAEREALMNEEIRRFPAPLSQAMAADLAAGELRPETLAALEAEGAVAVDLLKRQYLTAGLIRLGGVLRIPADLADPVLAAGAEGYPAGVAREYYAFVEANLGRIPVVVDGGNALRLERKELSGYWRDLLGRSRLQAPVIRTGLFRDGRLVDHRAIDFRSPVFGVAQIAYSRAVTAIAATWLALWRDANGDLTRMPKPREVRPEERR
jgi:ribosome modulation factor